MKCLLKLFLTPKGKGWW